MAARLGIAAALLCVSVPVPVRAQDGEPAYGARAQVDRPFASTNRIDPTAAGTEIATTASAAAFSTLDEVLNQAPGAHAMRTGWLGSYTSAALRGAETEHTSILIGDIPVSSADSAAFDLSTLPVELFDRVTVFRGGAPLWLAQSAIGGVVQLEPRSAFGNLLTATSTVGSFDTYGLSLTATVVPEHRDASLHAHASVLGTQGDFVFRDDNRTTFVLDDDYDTRRRNADMLQGHGLVHSSAKLGPGRLSVLALGFERVGGEPGSPAEPAYKTRRALVRGVGGASYTLQADSVAGERAYEIQTLAALGLAQTRFADLFGELGGAGAKQTKTLTSDAFGRVAARAAAAKFLDLSVVATARGENRSTEDPFARIPLPDSSRTTFFSGAELRAHGRVLDRKVELRPSVRVEHQNARIHSERFGMLVKTKASDTLPTYRAAAAVEVFPDLTLSASVATGVRSPSITELFGDAVFILGNTALRPERSKSFDLGLTDVTCVGDFDGTFEARVFDLSIEDQIIFERNSFGQIFARNLVRGHVQGIELGAHANYTRHFSFAGAATFLNTEGKTGKRLPNRPRAQVYGSPALITGAIGPLDAVRLFVAGSYISASFDDPDNGTLPKPSQIFFELGTAAVFDDEHAELRVSVSDLFDRGGMDVRRFPLPGRTLMASITYKEDE